MIEVGDQVWYYATHGAAPLVAWIAWVNANGTANLMVIGTTGTPFGRESVVVRESLSDAASASSDDFASAEKG